MTFPFGFCQNSREIYRSQIEPVWHDIISSPPGEYILFSHSFRKRKPSSKLDLKIFSEALFTSSKWSFAIKRMIPTSWVRVEGQCTTTSQWYRTAPVIWQCDKSAKYSLHIQNFEVNTLNYKISHFQIFVWVLTYIADYATGSGFMIRQILQNLIKFSINPIPADSS